MFDRELRLVVTKDCNYNCVFCHEEAVKRKEKAVLDAGDYEYLFETCNEHLGWNEVTLTRTGNL
ncbi:MAG: hypothetical protein PHE29_10130 [Tissierellia bacterium]|nr:hypothetical protein [Tissierellia bacterium]